MLLPDTAPERPFEELGPIEVTVRKADKSEFTFTARCRIDTYNELEYFRSGGILHYVLRRLAS